MRVVQAYRVLLECVSLARRKQVRGVSVGPRWTLFVIGRGRVVRRVVPESGRRETSLVVRAKTDRKGSLVERHLTIVCESETKETHCVAGWGSDIRRDGRGALN